MVEFSYVVEGLKKYVECEIYPHMDSVQRVAMRFAVARMSGNPENLLAVLNSNGLIRSLGIVDSDGYVDVDSIRDDLKREIQAEEKLVIDGAMFGKIGEFVLGKITLTPRDIDVLHRHIMEGVHA